MAAERVFADTNLFLRYLTDDIPAQADAVERLLDRAAAGEIVLATTGLVLAEIIWALDRFYHLSRTSIREKVLAILNTPGLDVVDGDLILQAIDWYADKTVDFVDAYHGAWLLAQGIHVVYTFDRKHFSRLEGITVRTPGEEG